MNALMVLAVLILGGRSPTHRPVDNLVRVPRAAGLDLSRAYTRLHGAGLRVSYLHSFADGSFECEPTVGKEQPAAGQLVRRSSTVILGPRQTFCGLGSRG